MTSKKNDGRFGWNFVSVLHHRLPITLYKWRVREKILRKTAHDFPERVQKLYSLTFKIRKKKLSDSYFGTLHLHILAIKCWPIPWKTFFFNYSPLCHPIFAYCSVQTDKKPTRNQHKIIIFESKIPVQSRHELFWIPRKNLHTFYNKRFFRVFPT